MRGCADAGGMEEVTLFKRKVSDRSTVTPDFMPMSPSMFVWFRFFFYIKNRREDKTTKFEKYRAGKFLKV